MYYHFQVFKEDNGYWAKCIELDGCQSQSDSIDELEDNLNEVLNLYLDEPTNSRELFPLPDDRIKESDDIISVKVDPQIAFAFYLRMIRLQHHMTQKEVAVLLGLKHLYSYQRLESSQKANPELKTLEKLKEVFPEFDLNLVV